MNKSTQKQKQEEFRNRFRYVLFITGFVLITSGIIIQQIGFRMFGLLTEGPGELTELPEQTQIFITHWNLFMYAVPITLCVIGLSAILVPLLEACVQEISTGLNKLFNLKTKKNEIKLITTDAEFTAESIRTGVSIGTKRTGGSNEI